MAGVSIFHSPRISGGRSGSFVKERKIYVRAHGLELRSRSVLACNEARIRIYFTGACIQLSGKSLDLSSHLNVIN